MSWSWRAEANLEAVRLHRSQLMRVQKSLDEAYYQLKRANAALVAAWNAADAAERFKSEFVANVSHELRTPLNLIIGYSEVIMTSPESYGGARLPGVYRTDINAIYHSAQHLLALVDDVLDLARIDVGKLTLSRDEVDIGALVVEALEIVRDYIVAKGLDLQVNIAPDLPRLWLDRLRIRQVLLNLLVNAARFTEKGFIRIDVQGGAEQLLIRVTDSGRGIPAHDLTKIFDEFRSTEQPLSTWHSGTGLGLPISKKFVELNGGAMGVDSARGQGSSFWVQLPCRPADPPSAFRSHRRHPGPAEQLTRADRVVVVAHPDQRMAGLLERHLTDVRILRAATVEEGSGLAARTQALALLTGAALDAPALPTELTCLHCALVSEGPAAVVDPERILVKPVTRQVLEAALARLDRPVKRILIADDDPELVRLFRRMLSSDDGGREFFEAYTGEEALRLMRTLPLDVVLLDLVMPDGDGYSVLAQMAADPVLSQLATLVVSARALDLTGAPTVRQLAISRPAGFGIDEVAGALDAALKALTPGWYPTPLAAPTPAATAPG